MCSKAAFYILTGAFLAFLLMDMVLAKPITIFMAGDVMIGRGIDQILPHPSDPAIHEPYIRDARDYVRLAERVNGLINKPVDFPYIWGDALNELKRIKPDLRIINLETSITKSDDYWKGKDIHYRMNPENISALTIAEIDYVSLANNHILDWGYLGLKESLDTLRRVNIKTSGAGLDIKEAEAPVVIRVSGKGRVIIFSYGSITSGIPLSWAAGEGRAGINILTNLSNDTVMDIKMRVTGLKQKGDIVIVSIHWGGNWGYHISDEQVEFAHGLIDIAGVDVIHGHSSHHIKGIEVYKEKLIIYGCGDFLNDYEGISGYEEFRNDLGLMYFATVESSTGKLLHLRMIPTQIKRFRVTRATEKDTLFLKNILNKESRRFGTKVRLNKDDSLTLQWE